MSSIGASLVIIQQNVIRYGFPLLLVFGNFGNLCFIVLVSQQKHRRNPCSLYLLASAIFGLIGMNWGFGPNLNALYQSPDPFTVSLILCRTRGYILQITSVLFRSMIILACIDRFALSSSQANIRAFSTSKIARKMIVGTTLFWMIASIHLPIFETIQNNRCYVFGSYGIFFSIYQICLFGVVLPGLMTVFAVLLRKNLTSIRIRPQQEATNLPQRILHKRDVNLMKFILAEVIVGMVLSFLYPINTLYQVLVSNVPNKSQQRIQIEGFINFIVMLVLFYLNYCITFYLYIIMSKSFRNEIKRVILKCLRRPVEAQTIPIGNPVPLRNLPNIPDHGSCHNNVT